MIVVPALIPKSKDHLLSACAAVVAVAHEVQIDLVDGQYAGVPSWPWNTEEPFREVCSALHTLTSGPQPLSLEIDLMVVNPEKYIEELIAAGVSRLVVHVGSTTKLDTILTYRNRVKIGLAFTNGISLEPLKTYASQIDFVQCMGIADVGVQGNAFDGRVLARIAEIRSQYPTLEIGVDGHVTRETLPLLKQAGATRFMSGSAIFAHENPALAFLELQKLAEV